MRWLLWFILAIIVSLFLSFVWPLKGAQYLHSMEEDVNAALAGTGVSAEMFGNTARLTGEVGSESAKDAAIAAAQNADCKMCKGDRSWHKVDGSRISVAAAPALPSPYTFSAIRREDGEIILDGYVPSETDKASVLATANKLYPGRVSDRTIRVSDGAPNAAWAGIISTKLGCLDELVEGQMSMSDTAVTLSGKSPDEATKAKIERTCGDIEEPYTEDLAIEVLPQIESVDACQTLLNEVNALGDIKFETDSAVISGDTSFDLLNTLGSAAKRCAAFSITVEGHTDNEGADAYNQQLSERRAKSVVAYLADVQSIDIKRMNAIGYGESRPIASNDTEAGKAENRRIEFTVSRSE